MSFLSYTQDYNDNLLMLLLRDHKRYMPIVEFFDNMTRNLAELSWADAELIAAEVSKANRSEFCTGIRGGMTKALKVGDAALGNKKLKAAITFALKINQRSDSIMKVDIDELLSAGWSEQTIEDIVGLVAIQKLYNIIAMGLGFKQLPELAFAEIGLDTVNNGGYVESFRQFIEHPA
jgi:alkylhydroperoxidase/carboxymuconolactone decarboxylase family protein YurZ